MNFYEFYRLIKETEIPRYDSVEDVNSWNSKRVDLILNNIQNQKSVTIYPKKECINDIRNFSNKNLLVEIQDTTDKILNNPDAIRGREQERITYLKSDIKKAYQSNFINSFDNIRSACLNVLTNIEKGTKITETDISLTIPKEAFVFLCKWASVSRTFDGISSSLGNYLKGIDQVTDDHVWQEMYYVNEEVKKLFPILNLIIDSIYKLP